MSIWSEFFTEYFGLCVSLLTEKNSVPNIVVIGIEKGCTVEDDIKLSLHDFPVLFSSNNVHVCHKLVDF